PGDVRRRAATVARAWRDRRLAREAERRHRALLADGRGPGVLHPRMLFVGAGDVGRTAFALGAARAALPGCRMESAGLDASPGASCKEHVVSAARELAVDLAGHRATRLTRDRVAPADVVLVMDMESYERLGATYPWAVSRATLLGLFASPPVLSLAD